MLHMGAANTDLAIKDFDAVILIRPELPAPRGAAGLLRMLKKSTATTTSA